MNRYGFAKSVFWFRMWRSSRWIWFSDENQSKWICVLFKICQKNNKKKIHNKSQGVAVVIMPHLKKRERQKKKKKVSFQKMMNLRGYDK